MSPFASTLLAHAQFGVTQGFLLSSAAITAVLAWMLAFFGCVGA